MVEAARKRQSNSQPNFFRSDFYVDVTKTMKAGSTILSLWSVYFENEFKVF